MVSYELTTEIDAPAATVVEILHNMKGWVDWTRTVVEATPLGDGVVRPGARVRVRQPKVPTSVWTVDRVDPTTFEWNNLRLGLSTVATHTFADTPTGCSLTVTIRQSGPFAGIVGLLYGGTIRRFLTTMSADITIAAQARTTSELHSSATTDPPS
ncbi:hypothetical protein acdb102_47690 [Acidothermaceae bacterium B102]|nr:hypothetical protein acdb102_47690 [Acidothermaceae bacterium B102]